MADPQAEARIRDLEQRMAAMPGSRIFVGLAEEYRRAGRLGDALATLRSGLEAHPTYLSARISIARLYQEMGRDEEAIEAFARVLAADRENLVAAKALGDLHARGGNAVEAIKKYKLYRALSGDRAVDARIAALDQEARAEAPAPTPPPPEKPAEPRMFDPINFSDSSAEFRFNPNATISLSTLEFSPAASASESPAPPAAGAEPPSSSAASGETLSAAEAPSRPIEEVTLPEIVVPPREPGPEASQPPSSIAAAGSLPTVDRETAAPDASEAEMAEEMLPPAEEEETAEPAPELPPSRTLAELYERQGFREEARRIYERLAAEHPDDESLTRRIASVREVAPPVPGDGRSRRRSALESWIARVRAHAASGTRPA